MAIESKHTSDARGKCRSSLTNILPSFARITEESQSVSGLD